MTAFARTSLYEGEGIVVEHIAGCGRSESKILVFSFTERGNTDLLGLGFGGQFLLDCGFDIVAVKSSNFRWFEELTHDVVNLLNSEIEKLAIRYSLRVSYGSSMGAYGAIRHSRALHLDRVVAISPMFDIRLAEDSRYQADIANLRLDFMMTEEFVSPRCEYIILYDPFCADSIHTEKYRRVISKDNLNLIVLGYSGHPSGFFLSEVGVLKELVKSLILGCCAKLPKARDFERRKSTWYLSNLSSRCYQSRKFRWAATLAVSAQKLCPTNPEIATIVARALIEVGDRMGAEEAAQNAIALDPGNHRKTVLVEVLRRKRELDAAQAEVNEMVQENLALGRPATQSSVSQWSNFASIEADARGANNGIIDGNAGFHTASETCPWWQVDLRSICILREVRLFNRQHCAFRLRRFSILASIDGERWESLFRKSDGSIFGEQDLNPYVASLPDGSVARFVRIRLDDTGYLHFSECQIIGAPAHAGLALALEAQFNARLDAHDRNELQRSSTLRDGRRGQIANVGDIGVFVDIDRYSPVLVRALTEGKYEDRERMLVSDLLREDDRVLEVGTAVGVVAMTAARIVGAENIITYDANPAIVADAQRNFIYNGLGAIRLCCGVLQNRSRFGDISSSIDFFVSRDFWASRLFVGDNRQDIIATISVPTECLEDQIAAHRASVIVCDIEGGEIDLIVGADLTGVRLLIMEIHDWAVGQRATGQMIRYLVTNGFDVDLYRSGSGIAVLYR